MPDPSNFTVGKLSDVSERTKAIRRIVLYVCLLGYAGVEFITRKSNMLDYVCLLAISLAVIAQLIDDVKTLRQ